MRKFFYIYYAILFCLYSCSLNKYDNTNPYYMQSDFRKFEMKLTETVSFKLDSITSNITLASEGNSDYFSFLTNNNEIQIFNYKTKEFQSKIPLQTKGITTYCMKNSDSVFLYDYYKESIIFTDRKGNIKEVIDISHHAKYYPSPVTGISPLTINDNKVIISGNMSGEYMDENEQNRPTIFSFDLKSKKINYIFSYPECYFNSNWGGGLLRWVYSTYNENRQLIVCSYPSDHYVHTFDMSGKQKKIYYAGSQFIDKISPLSKNKIASANSDDKTKHFVENHSYANVCYDKYNMVYYRIGEFKTKYNGIPGWKKELSIIILDRNFKIIGETKIGKSHASNYRYTLFVNYSGLHIQQNSDENQIMFNIYKLIQNEI